MTDVLSEGAADGDASEKPGGSGGESLADTRAYLTRRMQAMAPLAMDAYEAAMKPGSKQRNVGAALSAARDVMQMLTEGKVSQPAPEKPTVLASVTDLAALSESVRIQKQNERRGR